MLRLLATNSIIEIIIITIAIIDIITITIMDIITITTIDIIIVSSPSLWSLPTRHCIVARFHDILRPLLLIRLNLRSDC